MAKYINIEQLYTFIDNQGHITIDDLNGVEDTVELPKNFRAIAAFFGREIWLVARNQCEACSVKKFLLVNAGFGVHGQFRLEVKERAPKYEDESSYIFLNQDMEICFTEEIANRTLKKWEHERVVTNARSCDKLRCVGNCNGKCCVEKCDGPVSIFEPGTNDDLEDAAKLYAGVKQYLAEMLGA